jgi:hypothetical protein
MSVRTVLLSEIRKSAVEKHQLSTGNGNYNRWSPLVQRDRSVSVGKRRLSDSTENGPGNQAKTPRFDSTAVLEQLKGQEKHLIVIKDTLGTLDYDKVIGQVLPQPVKDVITGLGKAVSMLLKSQENLTSVLVDVVKVSETSNKIAPATKILKPTDVRTLPRPPPTPVAPEVIA